MNEGVFPDKLNHADNKQIYKKESSNEKENFRLVSILLNLSKIFEDLLLHCLLVRIKKLRKSLDSGGGGERSLSCSFD